MKNATKIPMKLKIFLPFDNQVIEGFGKVRYIDLDNDWSFKKHLDEQGFDTSMKLLRLDFDTCNMDFSIFDRRDIMPKYTHCNIEIDGELLDAEYVTWSRITAFPLFLIHKAE